MREKNGKGQLEIIEGHDGGSYFWIMPVKQYASRMEGCCGVEEFKQEEISIEEYDIFRYLYYFLNRYFDSTLPYVCRDEWCGSGFQWNLEHNLYSYESMRRIITEIRKASEKLKNNYNDPSLEDLKSQMNVENCQEIPAVLDFYDRFCRRMEVMMSNAPQYMLISFMGP